MKSILMMVTGLGLCSCENLSPEQQARAAALADLALRYAEASGKIKAEDSALVREAKVIVLPETTPAEALPVEVVTSGK